MLWRRVRQANRRPQSRRNVAHHYDLSGALYDLFLDADRQYSCAYFLDPQMDLETAQLAKKRHIAAKLLLRPGDSVLDVGSGWGGRQELYERFFFGDTQRMKSINYMMYDKTEATELVARILTPPQDRDRVAPPTSFRAPSSLIAD